MKYVLRKHFFMFIFLAFLISSCSSLNYNTRNSKSVSNMSLSGNYFENQVWSGEIIVTGDTIIQGNLIILPGTKVFFEVGDDMESGDEVLSDGFNDYDQKRLKEYTISHSELIVQGELIASGTKENRIIFTSSSPTPHIADWVGIKLGGDNSIIEHSKIEWSRNGIVIDGFQPNTVVRHNIINNTFWGGINTNHSSTQVYSNYIINAGHGGIDVQGGNPKIEHNLIYNSHTGIVVLDGSPSISNNKMIDVNYGYFIGENATPKFRNNTIMLK